MKKADLNTIFTAKVTEYLAKGYIIYTDSMAGHQGEIAKVDLTNGEEVIRILLEDGPVWDKVTGIHYNKVYSVKVARATEIQEGIGDKTIWNNKLEILDQEDYYQPSWEDTGYLVSKEEATANWKKKMARFRAHNFCQDDQEITDKAYIKALLPYIHRLNGCKSVKARHIQKVTKEVLKDGSYRFLIIIAKKTTKVEVLSQKFMANARKASC